MSHRTTRIPVSRAWLAVCDLRRRLATAEYEARKLKDELEEAEAELSATRAMRDIRRSLGTHQSMFGNLRRTP